MLNILNPFRFSGPSFVTPSIDQVVSQEDSTGDLVHAITAPADTDHIIAVGFSTCAVLFDLPTDNSVIASETWQQIYSRNIGSWSGGFDLGLEVYIKQSDGDETEVTLSPSLGHSFADAVTSFVMRVSGLASGNPFDVSGEDDVADGTGNSLTLTLGSATSQATSLVLAVACFRDDDISAFSFSNLSDTEDRSIIRDNGSPSVFDLTGLMAAEVKTSAAAHSSALSITAGGNEELMGAILALNAGVN